MRTVLIAFIGILLMAAQPNAQEAAHNSALKWDAQLNHIETVLQEGIQDDGDGTIRLELRAEAETVLSEAADAARIARDEVRELQKLLEALGKPEEGSEIEEATAVKQRRSEITHRLSVVKGDLAEAEFARTRASSALADLSEDQREQLLDQLSKRLPLPVNFQTLEVALDKLPGAVSLPIALISIGWTSVTADVSTAQLFAFAILFVGSVFLGFRVKGLLFKNYVRQTKITEPNTTQRVFSTVIEGIARTLPWLVAIIVLMVLPVLFWGVTGVLQDLMGLFTQTLVQLVLVLGFARAALAPNTPLWRITPFSDDAARGLLHAITAFTIALTASDIILNIPYVEYGHELSSVLALGLGTLQAAFMISLLRESNWRFAKNDGEDSSSEDAKSKVAYVFWSRLRQIAVLAIAIAPLTSLAGYAALAYYILNSVLALGVLFGVAYLSRTVLQEIVELVLAKGQEKDSLLTRMFNFSESAITTIKLIVTVLIDLAITLILIKAALRELELPAEDVDDIASKAIQGFQIGSYTFSLTDLLLGIFAFVSVWMVSRTLQWVMNERIFPQTRLDMGVRNSLTTAVGYIGIIIGATLAVSTMGLDLSNLALVAGALSIGIGFGLQTVVGNFVAGLILLIERPIKIGDWVVVNDLEGTVKKINVRSTEIDTFQKASVIIPNADMISSSVTNWTHRDAIGRIDVPIGAAYGTDAKRVEQILLQIGRAHPRSLGYPSPIALFQGFGADSIDFELRIFVTDINAKLSIASQLRFSIYEAFNREGIEIPFRQHDLHVKSNDTLPELPPRSLPAVNRRLPTPRYRTHKRR